ncbi:hypothetical protein [Nostoc sp. KVJ20]|uniref:hypothetical protein n=1 Tax=Nostoc sp. KVJ20 TaxID=457944 RepID=UPI00083CDBF3|nr:hypothetical protein [Nostoc sp. KVJ20]
MKISTTAESHLKVNILLETREDGSAIASILELPQYRVEAANREQALLKLNQLLVQHLEKIEVIPMEIELPQTKQSQKPWMKFAGVFKDDPDFDIVQQYIEEYRQELDTTENAVDSSTQREAS